MKISGRTAIVTGGCQGIGRGIVYALLQKHAKVAILDVNDVAGKELEQKLKDEFGQDMVYYRHCDVSDKFQLKDAFHEVKSKFDGLHILVNNAGTNNDPDYNITVDVNLKAVIRATMLAIDMMDKNKGNLGGEIINISSMSGIIPLSFVPVYSATKSAVITFTRCLKAAKTYKGIQVNCICPTFVKDTEIFSMAEVSPHLQRAIANTGIVTVSMVANAVIQTIEDDSLAGNIVTVTSHGIKLFKFPKAKL
ncbi:15-hydroxyprostaglandin dehydrogenase [NAD(+)]-like [Xenia sp. Carnegie-2017]|uniref:15-hydroxyprostaglandin dehydrogenase [NAD(+)]-like n=1 Tax=Xenia sp. Carnegie-2017 TaxID=2897299 RepID=UPI001F03C7F1|nr:15-hydroxyprostaglandin dehydrogenase [NAD(+)]-like [Xenia sp. Carnegie-2017]